MATSPVLNIKNSGLVKVLTFLPSVGVCNSVMFGQSSETEKTSNVFNYYG